MFLCLVVVVLVRLPIMRLLIVKAAILGRSVNRAARMVRGLDPGFDFADD